MKKVKFPFNHFYFVWRRWGGGATMGCYQPLMASRDLGYENVSVKNIEVLRRDIAKIKNSVIFLFKCLAEQKIIDQLRSNSNIVISYPGDGPLESLCNYYKQTKNINAVIVASTEFKKTLLNSYKDGDKKPIVEVIPAAHDYFLESNKFKDVRQDKFQLYFGGSRSSSPTQGELALDEIAYPYSEGYFHGLGFLYETLKDQTEIIKQRYCLEIAKEGMCRHVNKMIGSPHNPSRYSCHYAVRAPWVGDYRSQWFTKTGGKVSTAAAAGSNIITSLDPCVKELIDGEYPYSINTETDEFKQNYIEICSQMIKYAESTFKTKVWYDGLKILEAVTERTKVHNILQEYIKLANHAWEETYK